MYYLDTKNHPAEPQTSSGFFVGWKIESGMRFRSKLLVADFEKVRRSGFYAANVIEVPAEECHFPEEVKFPFAEARKLSIEQMQPLRFPDDPPRYVVGLPWNDEAADPDKEEIDVRPVLEKTCY